MNLRSRLAVTAMTILALGTGSAASATTATTTAAPQDVIHAAGGHTVVTKGFRLAKNVHLPRAATQRPAAKGTDGSFDWSGYVANGVKGVSVRYVSANFFVPTINCATSPVGSQGTGEYQWIGFDGFNGLPNDTVEQVGIGGQCVSGAPQYFAYYDMAPSPLVTYTGPISAGDAITASVYYNVGNHEYTLYLRDDSTGGDINTTAICPVGSTCLDASAEAISAALGQGPSAGYDLGDFAMEDFTSVGVTAHDGYHGSLAASKLWSSDEVVMEDSSDVPMVQPSSLQGGESFSTTWLAGA
jgi:hypothetical protein